MGRRTGTATKEVLLEMVKELQGKRIAFLATDGVEQVELTEPWKAVEHAGGEPELVSLETGEIQGFQHHDKGRTFPVDRAVADADPSDYDGLVLPGGVVNPDVLRTDETAVGFVRSFFEQGKPVGAICHGIWMLVEADVVRGRTLTSWPSLRTDVENAGGTWVDEEVCVDRGLFTSRKPDDLRAFCRKLVEEIGEGVHEEQREAAREALRT
ncbi:MAG TPA: type 1 glutamine amidotransferase domain-containing protein [Gaiellaceae bacterium]|nr:type 1 glutamine amidotransferase domain-containing protein [Gaiellaceae bacterium]